MLHYAEGVRQQSPGSPLKRRTLGPQQTPLQPQRGWTRGHADTRRAAIVGPRWGPAHALAADPGCAAFAATLVSVVKPLRGDRHMCAAFASTLAASFGFDCLSHEAIRQGQSNYRTGSLPLKLSQSQHIDIPISDGHSYNPVSRKGKLERQKGVRVRRRKPERGSE